MIMMISILTPTYAKGIIPGKNSQLDKLCALFSCAHARRVLRTGKRFRRLETGRIIRLTSRKSLTYKSKHNAT